jgi:Ca2+-transporting ATPase
VEAVTTDVGDPLELAMLRAARRAGLRLNQLERRNPREREEAFDPGTRMMATVHGHERGKRVAVKGAPEAVLNGCSRVLTGGDPRSLDGHHRRKWLARSERLAEEGLRVIALAEKFVQRPDEPVYEGLVLLALVGLADPPRSDVSEAIRQCREARIRVVMMTGDHAATARYIASAAGLTDEGEAAEVVGVELKPAAEWTEEDRERLRRATIFARVDPRQKLDLVALYQQAGDIVAMTGDGVNDAPALKKANIGIAMGLRGTQVAREAADMVLKDDAFSTIVVAVGEGRIIFTNIRKFVVYLLSCNASEILVVALTSLVNAPLPLLPLQILFLNLVTDVFPAMALGAGEGDASCMSRPPRDPAEPIVRNRDWLAVAGYGGLITASVLGAFSLALLWLEMPTTQAVTVSFLTLGFAQLWHVFNMRDADSDFWRNDISRNPYVWAAVALCVMLLCGAVYLPGARDVLDIADPGARGWLLVGVMSVAPLLVGQFLKVFRLLPVRGPAARP